MRGDYYFIRYDNGNIHIYSFFMKNIECCLEHPEEIGSVFQRSEKRLQIYVKYCQNKPTSEYIVSEYSNYFEVCDLKLVFFFKCSVENYGQWDMWLG